ncbi:hypothetical protein OK016_24080 [Vibrio chagasii]|nr:hypothetical protein [Vibrio chagasii]
MTDEHGNTAGSQGFCCQCYTLNLSLSKGHHRKVTKCGAPCSTSCPISNACPISCKTVGVSTYYWSMLSLKPSWAIWNVNH